MGKKNPMRWDCKVKGCFNKLMRPKLEVFAECLPRTCQFTDVDGLVEINGKGLLLEWKHWPMRIPTGQRIAFERLTRGGLLSVICMAGDAATMEVTHMAFWFDGKFDNWDLATLDEAKQEIRKWVAWAERVSV